MTCGRNFYLLSHLNDYLEPMAIVTAWVKIYVKYFCNARVGELFVQQKFLFVQYTMSCILAIADVYMDVCLECCHSCNSFMQVWLSLMYYSRLRFGG